MSMTARAPYEPEYWYPDSDGVPMSENMKQGRLIRMLISGFDRLYRDEPNVLVGGDCFWYPVEEDRSVCVSPDVIVVFDTPKADHPSVRTFEHGGVVRFVAEVVSPSNTYVEMRRKRQFYEDHGVDEYWVYDPETGDLEVWFRVGDRLDAVVRPDNGWESPLLGVTVRTDAEGELYVTDPDGEVWLDSREEGRVALARRRMLVECEGQVQQMKTQLDTGTAQLDEATAQLKTATAQLDEAETGKVVPTWNYETVQVRGLLVVHDEPEWKLDVVTALTNHFEADRAVPWHVTDAPDDYIALMLRGIVGIELVDCEFVGKRKLS